VKRRLPVSGKQLAKAIERRGWRRIGDSEGLRAYRSPNNPKLIVVIEYSGWPLPDIKRRKLMRLLSLKLQDIYPSGS
jgi:predicted RNA binding protein YcfA (HicA-like mRNA interferase family)